MKIQINSLEALERLIGGDSSVEIDIRQSVVEAFTRKHLKSIANQSFVEKISTALKKELEEEFVKEVKNGNWNTTPYLTDKTKELLDKNISFRYQDAISTAVSDYFNKSDLAKTIEEKSEWVAKHLTEKVLNDRFDAQVDLEIKKRLGIK